jgi:hypothetical protein
MGKNCIEKKEGWAPSSKIIHGSIVLWVVFKTWNKCTIILEKTNTNENWQFICVKMVEEPNALIRWIKLLMF